MSHSPASCHSAFVSRWEIYLGSGPPCCQPPTACSQRPHHWLSGLRPSHFPCPPFPNPGLSGPLLGQSVLPSHCQAGACGHLSVSVLCPTPPPLPSATCGTNQLPSAPLQPAHTCGLAGLLLPGLSPTVPPKDSPDRPHTHSDRHTHTHQRLTSNSPLAPAVL